MIFFTEKNPKIQNSNLPRECIRYFFPVRKCFVFDRPTNDKNLLFNIEDVPESQLEWSFQVQSKNFCSYIFTNGKTKTLRQGIIVTGNRELSLVWFDLFLFGLVSQSQSISLQFRVSDAVMIYQFVCFCKGLWKNPTFVPYIELHVS